MTFSWFKTSNKNGLFGSIFNALANTNQTNHHEERSANEAHKVNDRVRKLNAENDIVASIRRNFENSVIRTKLNIQSMSEDEEFNGEFEKWIKTFSKRGNFEITGRFYRGLMERKLVAEAEVLAGGFIIVDHYSNKFPCGYKIEALPLHAIDRTQDNFMEMLFNGIQTNKNGEITHIWLYTDHTHNESRKVSYKRLTLHVDPWMDLTQYSGTSKIAPILATLDVLHDYTQEEIRGAKKRASNNLIIKTHFYAEIKKMAQAMGGKQAFTIEQMQQLFEKSKIADGDVMGAKYIPQEDEVVELGKSTDSVFAAIYDTQTRTLSGASGLSPMSTVNEMPKAFYAVLYSAQKEEATYEVALEDFVELTWRNIFEVKLLRGLILKGLIKRDDYWTNSEKYEALEFMRASVVHIDGTKTQKEHTEGLVNGTKNEIDIAANNGKDWKRNIENQYKVESERKKMAEKYGLPYVPRNIVVTPMNINEGENNVSED